MSRVGAILSANKTTVNLIGYGVQIADAVPPRNVSRFGIQSPCPCIQLDDGNIVFGFECWWGPEERVRQIIGDRMVVHVPFGSWRANALAPDADS